MSPVGEITTFKKVPNNDHGVRAIFNNVGKVKHIVDFDLIACILVVGTFTLDGADMFEVVLTMKTGALLKGFVLQTTLEVSA